MAYSFSAQKIRTEHRTAAIAIGFDGRIAGTQQPLQAIPIHKGSNRRRRVLRIYPPELLLANAQLHDFDVATMTSLEETGQQRTKSLPPRA